MYITVKTVLTFDLPRKKPLMDKFIAENDMNEWDEHFATSNYTFVKENRFIVGWEGEE